jgi:hypothetical protein
VGALGRRWHHPCEETSYLQMVSSAASAGW